MITDITGRRRAEKEIAMLAFSLRSINECVSITDMEDKILFVNESFKKTYGYSEEELIGKNILIVRSPNNPPEVVREILPATLRGKWNGELWNKRKDGSEFPIYLSTTLINDKGSKPLGLIGVAKDITERKRAEEELAIANRKLAVSNEDLERYAYVTSHDLQEPLRMVTSFLQLLQKKYGQQLDDTAQKYINFAVDGATRMKTLILDLLEFSRISSVKQQHTIINLNDVIAKTRQVLKAAIDESQATINVHFLPEVCGNESQLLQLFQNLIGNAIKYTGNLKPVIEIGYTETPGEWQFYVQDNGIGIDKKFFEKIFIISQRLHTKKEYEGTGIGLAICKKIVELHGGKIWVESEQEKGSIFYFTISKIKMNNNTDPKDLCPGILENP
jgi:PAS domain S-box-containing protein